MTPSASASVVPQKDIENFNTLKEVYEYLDSQITGLYKEFNAFDVRKNDMEDEAVKKFLREVDGKQIAYDILVPALDMVKTAIDKANIVI